MRKSIPHSLLYVVRRDGKVHFEGDLASLRAWLAENRIKGDDEVRRQGYEVLESEKLWSLVNERSELGFNAAEARDKLKNALRLARVSYICFFGLCILAGCYLYLHQGVPRFEYTDLLNEAESRHKAALSVTESRAREAEIASKKSFEELSLKFTKLEVEHLKVLGQVKKLSSDMEMQVMNYESLNADFRKVVAREQELLNTNRLLTTNLDEQRKVNAENEVSKPSFERTVLLSWGNSPFGGGRDRYLEIKNISDVEIQVSVDVVNRKLSFNTVIPPQGLYKSSQDIGAPLLYVGDRLKITVLKWGFVGKVFVNEVAVR